MTKTSVFLEVEFIPYWFIKSLSMVNIYQVFNELNQQVAAGMQV